MGFPRPFFRAAIAALATSALVASGLALAAPASADPANPTPVSGTALPTAQVNGVVWSQAVSDGIDFVGGSFTSSRPAGAAAGVDETPRANLFAFDVSTGLAVPGFNAVTNGQVRSVAVSADGAMVFIGGDFTSVNGSARKHIAAIDRSGRLIEGFAPSLNAAVYSIVVRDDEVFAGGSFTTANGEPRGRVAAFSSSGVLAPFAPNVANFTVRALSMSPDGSKILIGGSFTLVNDANYYGLAAVDSTTGASLTWAANSVIHASGINAAIMSLSTRGGVVYGTGYNYGGDGNLEGMVAMSWADGGIVWIEDCHGDTYSSAPFNDAVYIAGHPHFCANVGGFGEMNPAAHRALGFSQAATHTLLHNTEQGPGWYDDFGGRPAPTLLDWYPNFSVGTFTGTGQATWSVAAGGSYLIYGGEFPRVNGASQAGLVRFQGQPEPADSSVSAPPVPTPTPTPTPTPSTGQPSAGNGGTTARPSAPRSLQAAALGPSKAAVRWTAPSKAAKYVTGYVVTASKGGKAIVTAKVSAKKRLAVLSHLKRATSYRITVKATSKAGTSAAAKSVVVKTKRSGKTVSAIAAPRKLHTPAVRSVTAHGAKVVWSAASAAGRTLTSGYQVRVYSGSKLVKVVNVGGSHRSTKVTGLRSGVRYTVSMRARNFAGFGALSASRALRTKG